MTRITAMVCPNCNGNLDLHEGQKYSYCPYCGVKLMIDNGEEIHQYNKTYRKIDEAEIAMAKAKIASTQAQEAIRLKELEVEEKRQKRKHKLVLFWIISLLVLIGLGFIKMILWLFAMVVFIWGLVFLIDSKDNEKK